MLSDCGTPDVPQITTSAHASLAHGADSAVRWFLLVASSMYKISKGSCKPLQAASECAALCQLVHNSGSACAGAVATALNSQPTLAPSEAVSAPVPTAAEARAALLSFSASFPSFATAVAASADEWSETSKNPCPSDSQGQAWSYVLCTGDGDLQGLVFSSVPLGGKYVI